MYTVDCDGTVIYEDMSFTNLASLIDPSLEIADNVAGKFTATIPTINVGYSKCKRMTSTITVKRDGLWLWEGRILQENLDFHNRKKITCEGALAYLNDSILEPNVYNVSGANPIPDLLGKLLKAHNEKVSPNRRIQLGYVSVTDPDNRTRYETNYETTFEWIKSNLVDLLGGHIRIQKNDGRTLKLDYFKDYPNTATQTIDFGVNLIDYTRDYDLSNICTVCIPRGKQATETSEDANDPNASENPKYITIADVNGGSIYLQNTETVARYGRIERVVDFSDCDDPTELLKLATIYMNNLQFDDMILSIKAVDLSFLNPNIKSFNLLDKVRCVSAPHGLDKFFPITAITLPLGHPENFEYTMGTTQSSSMSGSITSVASNAKSKFNELQTRESVLVEAFRNTNEILSRKTTGYVSIIDQGDHSQAIIISNQVLWTESDTYWKFDMNGLGFFKRDPTTKEMVNKGIAITMDGQIVADYITTGTMSADRIRTGVIRDVYNNNSINLETGEINLSSSKTKIVTDKGSYSLASTADIGTINGKINTISSQQATFKTDITGLQSDVYSLEASYGYCYTSPYEFIKIVSCDGFKLKKGAVIVVEFRYYNNTDYPRLDVNGTGGRTIKVNNDFLLKDSKENWGNRQTVTFVYDGEYWIMGNGATESHIRQLADSIYLSVTGKLGGTASITLGVDDDPRKTQKKTISLADVKQAFANDTSYVTVRAGRVRFESGTFEINAGNCRITSDGTILAYNAQMYGKFVAYGERYNGSDNKKRIELDAGSLRGYDQDNNQSYIAPGNIVYVIPEDKWYPSLQFHTLGSFRFTSPYISVFKGTDVEETSIIGYTGRRTYISEIQDIGEGRIQWWWEDIQFINGICTG